MSTLPKLCQPPAGFLMMSMLLGLTSGAVSSSASQQQRCPHHRWCQGSLASGSTTKPRLCWGLGGWAAGRFPCRLLDSGFWYSRPFQGQCSDLEGRLWGLFIFPGSLLQWEWGRGGENGREKVASSEGGRQGRAPSACACTQIAPRCTK